jgi:flavodoxin
MTRKGLIVYASHTGNTEKVALRFKKVFEEQGWACDCIKAAKGMQPVNPEDYDLVCIGSPILAGVHAKEISPVWMGEAEFSVDAAGGPPGEGKGGPPPGNLTWRQEPAKYKKGVVFVTYTGSMRGPAEALPALALMELQMEDRGFRCIGKLACPGRHGVAPFGKQTEPAADSEEMRPWHWNQQERPHERDLQKAEIFLAEILEDYFLPTEAFPDSQYVCIA